MEEVSVRYPPISAFTPQQKLVMAMIANGMSYREIALRLAIDWETARFHARKAAQRMPGDLPTLTKVHFWVRGATVDQFTGEGWIPELAVK